MPFVPRQIPSCACGKCAECEARASLERRYPFSPSLAPASQSDSLATSEPRNGFAPVVAPDKPPRLPGESVLDYLIRLDAPVVRHGVAE